MANDGFRVVIDRSAWYWDFATLSTSQLLVARDWDLEIDTETSDRLALGLVDGNWEYEMHWELAVLEMERNLVVFGWQEDDVRNECCPAMAFASNDSCLHSISV